MSIDFTYMTVFNNLPHFISKKTQVICATAGDSKYMYICMYLYTRSSHMLVLCHVMLVDQQKFVFVLELNIHLIPVQSPLQ